jgi:hypothetical protein
MFRMFWNLNVLDEAITFMKYEWNHHTSYFTEHIIRQNRLLYDYSTMICLCITPCRSWSAEWNSCSKDWETHQNGEANPVTASQVRAGHNWVAGHSCADRGRSRLHRWEHVTSAQCTVGSRSQLHMCWQVTAAQVKQGPSCTDGIRSQLHMLDQVTAAQAGAGHSCTGGGR